MKQEEKVLKYLLANKTITSYQAFDKLKVTRLSAVIYKLKKHGHSITARRIYGVNKDKEPYNYAEYKLED